VVEIPSETAGEGALPFLMSCRDGEEICRRVVR
jgi:hypothetical protein